ncbi:prepilin peptidase [Candidatus Nomurabacteria bacterium]|nr:prepilin peptidase [Candidatus Nomurabacteria bacterium]MCB9819379.1 prepilin peptidase [Candidatus Nomurabacteria bacterium]
MPEWFFIFTVLLFGLIIGSFLNVVIYRFHTNRSLNDRSHCLSCGTTLKWYELFPLLSYLILRGRCRSCQSFIPYRYALVEVLTAGTFLLAYLSTADLVVFLLLALFMSVLVVVVIYDLYHMIIPDELSFILAILALLIVGYEAWLINSMSMLYGSLFSGLVAFLFFFSLWWFSGGRWLGLGDAKLAVSLAMLVGISDLFSLVVWSFWVGALISVSLILFQQINLHKYLGFGTTRRVKMKSEVPFAPFLIMAFVMVYFFNANVLESILILYGNL